MSNDPLASSAGMIRQGYRPFTQPTDLLRFFLRILIEATNSAQGRICLTGQTVGVDGRDGSVLIVEGGETEPIPSNSLDGECAVCASSGNRRRTPSIAQDLKSEERCRAITLARGSSLAVPLEYQRKVIGTLVLASDRPALYGTPQIELSRLIATEIVYHLKRYELSQLIRSKLGKDFMCVGTSDALRRIDRFIEKASQVNLLALIVGEFGCEKDHVAYGLHFGGPRRHGPFVKVNCSTLDPQTFESRLCDLFSEADQGTIYFSGIDELEYKSQCQLSEILQSGVGQWVGRQKRKTPSNVGVVVSANRDLGEMVREGRFYQPLLSELDFLLIQIAPLRERKEDIKPLIGHFLRKYAGRQHRRIAAEALEICEAYHWPGNVYELERVVACLASMSEEETIRAKDLACYAPRLLDSSQGRTERQFDPGLQGDRGKDASAEEPADSMIVHLAIALIKGELAGLRNFHSGIQRALEYIARNYRKELSLNQLARESHVSASYLSHLFQKSIGVGFKTFLAIMRIERAKQLLVGRPYLSVTEISGEVGFEDLRNFERMFKRLVGCTPKDYRATAKVSARQELTKNEFENDPHLYSI